MASDSALTSGNFDEGTYLKYALHVSSMETEQQRLGRCIESVEAELAELVSQCHGPLIDDLQNIEKASHLVQGVKSSVTTLQHGAQRLAHTIEAPCAEVEERVKQLANIMKCVEMLRHIQRFLSLVGKLWDAMEGDVLRAARTLREIEDVLSDCDLTNITVVESYMDTVKNASTAIRTKAHELLKAAVASNNSVDCGVALQVFYTLDTLPKIISGIVADKRKEAKMSTLRELELASIMEVLAAEKKANDTQRVKELVFSRIEMALKGIVSHANALSLLWKSAHRKRDPLTQQVFATALYPEDADLLKEFWSSVAAQLAEKLKKLTGPKSGVHKLMVGEFPRYHRLLTTFGAAMMDFMRDTQRDLNASDAQLGSLTVQDLLGDWLNGVLGDVQTDFAAETEKKVRDKLQLAKSRIQSETPQGAAIVTPQNISMAVHKHAALPEQVTTIAEATKPFLKYITQELHANRREYIVLSIWLRIVKDCLKDLHGKMSSALTRINQPEVPTISNSMTGGAVFHVAIANAASLCSTEIASSLSLQNVHSADGRVGDATGSGSSLGDSVEATVRQLHDQAAAFAELSESVLKPFFSAATTSLSSLVVNFVQDELEGSNNMQMIEQRLHHFVSHYALLFDRTTSAEAMRQQLALGILKRFSAAACTVRPLSESLQGSIVRNLLELQTQVLAPLTNLERNKDAQKLTNALRNMFVLDVTSLRDQLTDQLLPRLHPVLILLHIFQRVDVMKLVSIHTLMRQSFEQFVEVVVKVMARPEASAGASIWEAASRCLRDFERRGDESTEDATLKKQVLQMAEMLQPHFLPSG